MTDNTEQKEQDSFEGVRAEFHAESVDHPICLILNAGDENEVSIECESVTVKREKLLTIVEQFANRWNNQATLKSEMNELSTKIVELQKEDESYTEQVKATERLALERGKEITRLKEEREKIINDLDVLTKLTTDQYAEIKSLKEENEALKTNNKEFRKIILDKDEQKSIAWEELEKKRKEVNRLERLLGKELPKDECPSDTSDLQSQLSQAKERIKELETPNSWQVVDSDSSGECLDAEISYALDGVTEDNTAVVECWPFHHLPKKHVAAKFREDTCSWESIGEFDTEEKAQAALQGGNND